MSRYYKTLWLKLNKDGKANTTILNENLALKIYKLMRWQKQSKETLQLQSTRLIKISNKHKR